MTEALTISTSFTSPHSSAPLSSSPSLSPSPPPSDASTLASLLISPTVGSLSSPPSPVPLSPSLSAEEQAAKKQADRSTKRTKIIAEIHDTERHYSSSIARVVAEYLVPLRANAAEWGLKVEQINSVFSNLEQLAMFHAALSVKLAEALTPRDVCTVFAKHADYLKMYTPYVNNYSEALKALQQLQDNKKFGKLCGEKKQLMGMDLTSYLIMPVQRIPRYELLLKELKRNLEPPSDATAGDTTDESLYLDETLAKIVSVAQKVNEAKREAERVSSLSAIAARVSHIDAAFPGGVSCDHRRVVKEGVLWKKSTFGKKGRNIFLFNDCLLWCSSFKYKGHVGLLELKAAASEHTDDGNGEFCIEVSHPLIRTLYYCADSQYDRQQWLNAFNEAIDECKQLDPLLQHKFAAVVSAAGGARHDRALSVSTNSRLKVDPMESASPVSPASPHPNRVVEEEDDISWEDNALKGEEEEEKEQDSSRAAADASAAADSAAAAGEQSEEKEKADVEEEEKVQPASSSIRPSHSRQQSRVLDIKPNKQPTVASSGKSSRRSSGGHGRNVSVVITSAGHSRKSSSSATASPNVKPVKEEKEAEAADDKKPGGSRIPTLVLNTASPDASKPATPSSSASTRSATASVAATARPASSSSSASASATVSLSSLSRNDITALKKMKSPPLPVKLAIESLAMLLELPLSSSSSAASARLSPSDQYWMAMQTVLVKPTFIRDLTDFETASHTLSAATLHALKAYIHNPQLTPSSVESCSRVAGILWRWVRQQYVRLGGGELPFVEELAKQDKKGPVQSKVDSGSKTARTVTASNAGSRVASTAVSRRTTPSHSRRESLLAGTPRAGGGVLIGTSRVSPSVTSPSSARPALSRQASVKDVKKPVGKETTAATGAGKKLKAAGDKGVVFSALSHTTLHLILAFLCSPSKPQQRHTFARLNHKCLHSALSALLDHNMAALAATNSHNTTLASTAQPSLASPSLAFNDRVAHLAALHARCLSSLTAVTATSIKSMRALVKPPASIVPLWEAVVFIMEYETGDKAAKDRRNRARDAKDPALTAHKTVLSTPNLTVVLASLSSPARLVSYVFDVPFLPTLRPLVEGLKEEAAEKSMTGSGAVCGWLLAVMESCRWMKAEGDSVRGVVEAEEGGRRLKAAGERGQLAAKEYGGVKDDKVREWFIASRVCRALRGQ